MKVTASRISFLFDRSVARMSDSSLCKATKEERSEIILLFVEMRTARARMLKITYEKDTQDCSFVVIILTIHCSTFVAEERYATNNSAVSSINLSV